MEMVGSHTEKTAVKHNLSGLVMESPREYRKTPKTRGDENWRQRLRKHVFHGGI
jgi:hypothetical protein